MKDRKNVTREEIESARKADLFHYLLKNHYSEIKLEGRSIRLLNNHSVSIKIGYSGYYDFATGESGNAIDCLVKYFGYSFVEAVKKLTDAFSSVSDIKLQGEEREAKLSVSGRFKGDCRNMMAYLTKTRMIPLNVVQKLLNDQLMYQESEHKNIVFINKEETFGEVHGTNSAKSFHGILKGSESLGIWWFKSYHIEADAKKIYICESAIDAISLYCLHQQESRTPNYFYCSIAGVGNQKKIEKLKSSSDVEIILAVDNDSAGDACRKRNADLKFEIPKFKDWNDDWRDFVKNNLVTIG